MGAKRGGIDPHTDDGIDLEQLLSDAERLAGVFDRFRWRDPARVMTTLAGFMSILNFQAGMSEEDMVTFIRGVYREIDDSGDFDEGVRGTLGELLERLKDL